MNPWCPVMSKLMGCVSLKERIKVLLGKTRINSMVTCHKEKCAWWDEKRGQCAVLAIAQKTGVSYAE